MKLLEMLENKEYYLNVVKEKWLAAGDSFPDFLSEITPQTRASNDLYVQEITEKLQKQFKNYPRFFFGRPQWRQATLTLIQDILYQETIIGLHKLMGQTSIDAFKNEVFDFLRHVRSFSPELNFYDIGQAVRNYIVYAMFKRIHNVTTGFSLAGFGYSMLYPFTDNYIDNTNCTLKDKLEYNQLIHNKINGNPINPRTKHQIKTCQLLQAIENEYPRDLQTGIQQLLLFMLEAQEASIRQQNGELPLTAEERLHISVYKGGISVLIDRFFVNKELTEEDFVFYLAFGYFLQLADDLQDIKEDSEQGHSTLFTLHIHCEIEEKLVNKLFHMLKELMEEYKADNDDFKSFIMNASYLLLLTSVIGSKEFFSNSYVEKLENYLPVSSKVVENHLNNRLDSIDRELQDRYINLLDLLLKA